jgi:hypothetical protein
MAQLSHAVVSGRPAIWGDRLAQLGGADANDLTAIVLSIQLGSLPFRKVLQRLFRQIAANGTADFKRRFHIIGTP